MANKGLGLKREQLKVLYQHQHDQSKDHHAPPPFRLPTARSAAAATDRDGSWRGGVGGRVESGEASLAGSAAAWQPTPRKQRPVNQINAQTLVIVRRYASLTGASHSSSIAKSRCARRQRRGDSVQVEPPSSGVWARCAESLLSFFYQLDF
jgi:hypothetical protein